MPAAPPAEPQVTVTLTGLEALVERVVPKLGTVIATRKHCQGGGYILVLAVDEDGRIALKRQAL